MSAAEESLQRFLLEREQGEGFRIETLDQATWAVRKIQRAQASLTAIDAAAEAEIARIEAWREHEAQEHRDTIATMESLLAPFVATQVEGSKKRSITLPHVKRCGFRKANPDYRRDDKVILAWLQEDGRRGFVKHEPKLDWAGLKGACTVTADGHLVTPDGEVVPSVLVEAQPDRFYIELEEEAR